MANYLPLLLVSVSHNAVPDDTSLSTQPRGQVDYLSHEWREEDVWRSWRNMTRQKNEIANGARLENASWRTWWKQRNKLKTISPETLNWLKDSDVTWLYGPLHTAVDWSPPPRPPPDPDSVGKDQSVEDRLGLSNHQGTIPGKKPILKHRSIGELLTNALPYAQTPDESPDELEPLDELDEMDENENDEAANRPPLLHTKSDTHITRWAARNHPFRKDSPPRIIAPVSGPQSPDGGMLSDGKVSPPTVERSGSSDSARETNTGGSSLDLHSQVVRTAPKKHISFNTFVEQCIAIDSPPKSNGIMGHRRVTSPKSYEEDEGYDEDSEFGYGYNEDIMEETAFSVRQHDDGSFTEDEDDDDEEEEVLEMRTSSNRSRSSSSSRSPHNPNGAMQPYTARLTRPPLMRTNSSDKEHMTIAPIAPTILKTTGVGNQTTPGYGTTTGYGTPSLNGHHAHNASPEVNLVYVPPWSHNSSTDTMHEDTYRHPNHPSRPGSGTPSSSSRSTSASESRSSPSASGSRSPSDKGHLSPVPSVEVMPPPAHAGANGPGEVTSPYAYTSGVTGPGLAGGRTTVGAGIVSKILGEAGVGAGASVPSVGGVDVDGMDIDEEDGIDEDVDKTRMEREREREARDREREREVVLKSTTESEGQDYFGGTGELKESAVMEVGGLKESGSAVRKKKDDAEKEKVVAEVVAQQGGVNAMDVDEPTTNVLSASPTTIPASPTSASKPSIVTSAATPSPSPSPLPHSHSQPVPVPRSSSHNHIQIDSSLLSPPSPSIPHAHTSSSSSYSPTFTRGRTPVGTSSPRNLSVDSMDSPTQSQSRGRSIARSSSYSDRERSGSRVSSPIGIGIVGSVSPPGGRVTSGSKGASAGGRGRAPGRRIGGSISPPGGGVGVGGSSSASVSSLNGGGPASLDAASEEVWRDMDGSRSPSSSSISGTVVTTSSSSSSGSSSSSSTVTAGSAPTGSHLPGHMGANTIPEAIMEEEETARSRQPTPANSPVRAFKISTVSEPSPSSTSKSITPSASSTKPSSGAKSTPSPPPMLVKGVGQPSPSAVTVQMHAERSAAEPRSPTSPTPKAKGQSPASPSAKDKGPASPTLKAQSPSSPTAREFEQGLLGKAADMAQSARGFWGSIWNRDASSGGRKSEELGG